MGGHPGAAAADGPGDPADPGRSGGEHRTIGGRNLAGRTTPRGGQHHPDLHAAAAPAVRRGRRPYLGHQGHGYQLVVSGDDIDIQVFERLVSSGRQALAQGRLAAAAERLSGALALWRGPAMAGVPETPTVSGRGGPARTAPGGRLRGPGGGAADPRPARRPGGRAAAPGPGAPVPGAAAGPTDARAVPVRAAARRPGDVPAGQAADARRARRRSRTDAAAAGTCHPCRRPGPAAA